MSVDPAQRARPDVEPGVPAAAAGVADDGVVADDAVAGDGDEEDAGAPLLARLNERGFRLLMLADALVVLGSLVVLHTLTFGFRSPTYPLPQYVTAFTLAAATHLGLYYFSGLYEREPRLSSRPVFAQIVRLNLLAVLIVAAGILFLGGDEGIRIFIPRGNLVVLPVLASTGQALVRFLQRRERVRREGPARVLLVGDDAQVEAVRGHLDTETRPIVVVASTGDRDRIWPLVRRETVTDVLLVTPGAIAEVYPEPMRRLEDAGINVLQLVTAGETLLRLSRIVQVGGLPFVTLHTQAVPTSRLRLKRLLELLGLLVLSPLLLVVVGLTALYVRLVAGSPVFFRQVRVGYDGRLFDLVKFRTMRRDAEAQTGAVLAGADDPRVIPSCRWLRATRLDELPQLWNVVRGEMSVVGPRPERPELTALFESQIPGYTARHNIPPGITGLAQVYGRYHTDAEFKLGYDLQYVVNWSPVLDLQILVRTLWVVLSRRA